MTYYRWLESPLASLLLAGDGRSLTGLYLHEQKYFPTQIEAWTEAARAEPFPQVQQQLEQCFAGQLQSFGVPLNPVGTDFQKQVWHWLPQIPFGSTIAYGTLAEMLGKPGAARAVGAANGRNPISIIVPCHRVIAADRQLTGYAGGIDRKRWLLQHEQALVSPNKSALLQTSLPLFEIPDETPTNR